MAVLKYYDQPSATYVTLPGLPGGQGPTGPAGPTGATGPVAAASQVSMRATRAAAFTCTTALTQMVFDTVTWDTNSGYNTSTGVYTIPVAGRYRIEAQVTASGNTLAGVYLNTHIFKNGVSVASGPSAYTSATTAQWMVSQAIDTVSCAVGDVIAVQIQTLGQNVPGASNDSTVFTIDLLGAGVGPTGPTGPAGPSANLIGFQQTVNLQAGAPVTITHNLNTTNILVQGWDSVTTQMVQCQVQILNANQIQVSVAVSAPNAVNFVLMGAPASPVPIAPTDLLTKAYVDSRTPALPGQILTGSGIQSFTDALGDVWVASNGVNNGNWVRARDALHARWYRAAAWTVTGSIAAVALDTPNFDKYSLFGSNLYTVPVSGLYLIYAGYSISAIAAGYFTNLMIRYGGPAGTAGTRIQQQQSTSSGTATGTYIFSEITWQANAGDQFWMEAYSTSGGLPYTGTTGPSMTYFGIDYLGTG